MTTIQRAIKRRFLDRSDSRIIRLMMEKGLEGYAVYVMLANAAGNTGEKACEYAPEVLAYDFHASAELVKAVAEDYGLFVVSGSQADTRQDGKRKEKQQEKELFPLDPHKEKERIKETENREKTEEKKPQETEASSKAADETNSQAAEAKSQAAEADSKTAEPDSHAAAATAATEEQKRKQEEAKRKFIADFTLYWNTVLKNSNSRLRPICMIDDRRYALLRRLYTRFSPRQVAAFAANAARSPYLNARDGRLKQPADINWMLATDERIVKIIEGNL